MKQNEIIAQHVEETLNSLDGLNRATPGPFFYTRLMAKMENEEKTVWGMLTSYITKPIVIATVVSLILLLNATVVFRQAGNSSDVPDQADVSMVDEYQIASTSFYDYSNAEP